MNDYIYLMFYVLVGMTILGSDHDSKIQTKINTMIL